MLMLYSVVPDFEPPEDMSTGHEKAARQVLKGHQNPGKMALKPWLVSVPCCFYVGHPYQTKFIHKTE